MTKRVKTEAHLAAKALRIGIGAGVHADGVVDALVLGFEDWSFTTHEMSAEDSMLVVVVPTNIALLNQLGDACHQIARFLETGEKPDLPTEPM